MVWSESFKAETLWWVVFLSQYSESWQCISGEKTSLVPPLFRLPFWRGAIMDRAETLVSAISEQMSSQMAGTHTQMHQHISVKPSEEHPRIVPPWAGVLSFWCICPGSTVEPGRLFFFLFCGGVTAHSVLAPVCIDSIFSSPHLQGRRCQVVQRSQRFTVRSSRSHSRAFVLDCI